MKEFRYKRDSEDVFVNIPLDFSDNEIKIYHKIITIKGKNGSYHDDQFLLPREKTGIYSHCWCFLEEDYISLKFCSMGYDAKAKPTIDDIEAEYDNYRDQLIIMIKEVLRLQEMIKLIPEGE
jgi:hypothetical protein